MSDQQAVECASRGHGGARQHGPRPVPASDFVLSLIGIAAAAAGVSALQLHEARRRYGSQDGHPGTIDLTVAPPDPTLADGKPIELLALGDSGMAGVGVTVPAAALPAQIAQRVAASTGRPVHVVSHAQPGARTHDVLTKQLTLDLGQPDVVVLLVGTNDVTHLSRTRQLAEDTANLFARLHRLGAPVVMSCLPEFGAMRAVPPLLRTFLRLRAVVVRRVHVRAVLDAESGVELVGVRELVGREFLTNSDLMSPDRFHPSEAGYSRIADVLAPTVLDAITRHTESPTNSNMGLVSIGGAA
jgi:lysophospholipase L1-like esterase